MGMYNDFRGTKRDGWVYTYKGSELLAPAKRKQEQYAVEENKARNALGDFYKDTAVSANDKKIEDLKVEVARLGNLHEQCDVFVHEFARTPEREFHLSLGDVTFFDLHVATIANPLTGTD